ncbi:thioesterase family protein [Pedobacter sp. MC2016-14]|uniref:acyl-CoA thioesterase n=1 Tax=Pedobacter sp. MC2016-14 TaxID=2897327 RepID=UPI001E405BE6|nr:thioesterase family protein [Pedobacter sp. MC2016-14]MCD0490661.1 thioesterase family protein [Pedobacter sp. MC2016-14]
MDYLNLRWSDLDPNFHLRHSSYYDLAAQHRIEILDQYGITIETLKEHHVGPVLFKEQCEFKREIHLNSKIYIVTKLLKMKRDGSFWIIQHDFISEEGKLHAIIKVEGSWIDIIKRKLSRPVPEVIFSGLENFPKSEEFEFI